jgi:hypothetical protein
MTALSGLGTGKPRQKRGKRRSRHGTAECGRSSPTPIAWFQEHFRPIVLAAAVLSRPRFSRAYGMLPTANGVSSRPFSPQFSRALGFEKLGRLAESMCFFWPQTQGPKDFLGFGPRAKRAIIRGFRGYPFPGRANSSRLGENGVLEEPGDGDFLWRFVDINQVGTRGPFLSDLRKPEVLRVLRLSQEQVRKCWKNRPGFSKPRTPEKQRTGSAVGEGANSRRNRLPGGQRERKKCSACGCSLLPRAAATAISGGVAAPLRGCEARRLSRIP